MKILIVDDEYIIRQGIRTVIEGLGKNMTVCGDAGDADTALKMIEKELPDVVLTDVSMPVMSGIELTKRIKDRFPWIVVVIISGYAEFSFAQKAMRYGAIDYILKPTDPDKLREVLEGAQKAVCKNRLFEWEKKKLSGDILLFKDDPACNNEQQCRRIIERAVSYIQSNYAHNLTLKHMSEVLFINPNYFCELFKQQTGMNFSDYIINIRIKNAKELLLSRFELKSYEICELVGYKNPKHFSNLFKKIVGVTPIEYREGKGIRSGEEKEYDE